jgi:hypothetical protein
VADQVLPALAVEVDTSCGVAGEGKVLFEADEEVGFEIVVWPIPHLGGLDVGEHCDASAPVEPILTRATHP